MMPSRDKNYFRRQVLTALLQPKLAYTFGYLITFCIPYVTEVTLYTDTRHLFLLPLLLNSYLFHTTLT
jgi:hypothetical protein